MKFLRQAINGARSARAFSSSAVSRKDLVQDLYVKELKSYKAPPPAKDAHVGAVKQYTIPPAPKAPALPSDVAAELNAYDASEPSKDAAPKAAATTATETAGEGAETFLAFLEKDEPKAEAHH